MRRVIFSIGLLLLLAPLDLCSAQSGVASGTSSSTAVSPSNERGVPAAPAAFSASETTTNGPIVIGSTGQQINVHVEGSGRLAYTASHLRNPERLVLDFAGVRLAHTPSPMRSGVKPVSRIRLGQFKPDVARVVIELEREVPYSVKAEGRAVSVAFGGAAVAETPPAGASLMTSKTIAGKEEEPVPHADGERKTPPLNGTEAKPDPPVKGAQPDQERTPAPVRGVVPRGDLVAVEPGQVYFELKYIVDGTNLQGNRERSFLHEGINHTAEFSFFSNSPFMQIRRLELLSVGRYTSNPRVDPERNSLQRFYLRLTGPSFEANVGDALVNYSRLTFNQNIRGLNIWKNLAPRLRFTGTTGFFTDRWGSLYRDYTVFRDISSAPDPANPGKPYSRLVGGTRLEQKFGRSNWLAGNWSHGKDLLQSLPAATFVCQNILSSATETRPINPGCLPGEREFVGSRRPSPEAINNDVLSLDTSLESQPLRLRFRGEYAHSWTSGGKPPANSKTFVCAPQPPIVGADVLDSRCFFGQVNDHAGRFEASEQLGRLNWRVDYSRFQPDFFSANARQIRDLQDFSVRGEFKLARQVSVMGSWRRSNDNLNGLRNFTNVVRAPEGRLVFRELGFYRRMIVEVGYRERNLDTTGNPLVTCFGPGASIPTQRPARQGCLSGETARATELRRRSTRIPFLSLSLPVKSTQVSFDYEHRHEMNAVNPQLASDTDRFAFAFRGRYTWGHWDFLPLMRFEIERLDKDAPRNAALSPTDITLLFPRDFFPAFDTNRSIQAGFLLEAPRYFRFEANYREFNSLELSPLQASKALDPRVPFLYLNQGFKRPSGRGAVTFKVANDENKTVTAFFERTNNFFATGDPFKPDTRSFRETVIGGAIVLRFRR